MSSIESSSSQAHYWAFCFLGVGSLMPWNAFITVSEYFQNRLCGTSYEKKFESAFGLSYNLVSLLFFLLMVKLQHKFSDKLLVLGSSGLLFATFLLTTVLVLVPMDNQGLFFMFSVLCLAASGALCGPYLTGLCRFAARLAPIYVSAIFTGQAVSGVIVSLVSFLTISLSPMEDNFCSNRDFLLLRRRRLSLGDDCDSFTIDWSAFIYFAIVALCMIFCGVIYLRLERILLLKNGFDGESLYGSNANDYATVENELVIADSTTIPIPESATGESEFRLRDVVHRLSDSTEASENSGFQNINELNRPLSVDTMQFEVISQKLTAFGVAYRIRWTILTVFLVFVATLSVFPSLTALTISTDKCTKGASRFANDLFTPLLFFIFNVGDLIGRVLTGRMLPQNELLLLGFAALRFLLLPFFLMVPLSDSSISPTFNSDFFSILLTFIFGGSNGYVCSAAMVLGPQLLANGPDRDFGSTLLLFFLTLGLLAGSLLSLLSVHIAE